MDVLYLHICTVHLDSAWVLDHFFTVYTHTYTQCLRWRHLFEFEITYSIAFRLTGGKQFPELFRWNLLLKSTRRRAVTGMMVMAVSLLNSSILDVAPMTSWESQLPSPERFPVQHGSTETQKTPGELVFVAQQEAFSLRETCGLVWFICTIFFSSVAGVFLLFICYCYSIIWSSVVNILVYVWSLSCVIVFIRIITGLVDGKSTSETLVSAHPLQYRGFPGWFFRHFWDIAWYHQVCVQHPDRFIGWSELRGRMRSQGLKAGHVPTSHKPWAGERPNS